MWVLSSRNHSMVGLGCPLALHTRSASSPSFTITSLLVWRSSMSGGTSWARLVSFFVPAVLSLILRPMIDPGSYPNFLSSQLRGWVLNKCRMEGPLHWTHDSGVMWQPCLPWKNLYTQMFLIVNPSVYTFLVGAILCISETVLSYMKLMLFFPFLRVLTLNSF